MQYNSTRQYSITSLMIIIVFSTIVQYNKSSDNQFYNYHFATTLFIVIPSILFICNFLFIGNILNSKNLNLKIPDVTSRMDFPKNYAKCIDLLTNNSTQTRKMLMFLAKRNRVACSHFVAVSITIGISSMIVVMLTAARRLSRGTIFGTAIASIAANITQYVNSGVLKYNINITNKYKVKYKRNLLAAIITLERNIVSP